MSVYVDPLVNWRSTSAPRCFRKRPSCHLYADSLEELHAIARRIGLKREWFQDHPVVPHYDLTPMRRFCAVEFGTIEHDRDAAVAKWAELRKARRRG